MANDKPEYEAHPSFRFYFEIAGVVNAAFTEVSGLQAEMEMQELEIGGMNNVTIRLPGRVKVSNVTLKRGMTKSNDFLAWIMSTGPGKIKRRNFSLVMYDVKGVELMRWEFQMAHPVKWVGPTFTADSTTFAIETVEFAHRGFLVK